MEEIKPIPELPEEVKKAAGKNLALFIGSGVSQLYDCDSWEDLAKRLVNSCYKAELIPYKIKDYLLRQRNPKKVITICQKLCDDNSQHIYEKALKEGLKHEEQLHPDNIYSHLYEKGRLETSGNVYLTTNIDTLFPIDSTHRLYRLRDFDPENISPDKLYHLHGCIEDIKSLVFTVPEYLERYTECRKYIEFLKKIFKERTVLFIGYGLDELEILQFMISKSIHRESKSYRSEQKYKRFILLPLYEGEENILKQEQSYFNAFNIKVIAYSKDKKGYEQLTDVIEKWQGEIQKHYEGKIKQDPPALNLKLVNDFNKIEDIVNEVGTN